MLEELTAASDALHTALDRYSDVCFSVQKHFSQGQKPHSTTPPLSLRMDSEVQLITSLETKLRRAKAAISWSRNNANTHLTINNLPSELLVHIFDLVLEFNRCIQHSALSCKKEETNPIVLSLVCSHWRTIVLNTPALWSHVDLSTSRAFNELYLNDIARIHLNHVGQLPLHLHICDSVDFTVPQHQSNTFLREQIAQLASHASSFHFDTNHAFSPSIHGQIVSTFIQNCTPRKLMRLDMERGDSYPGHDVLFIGTTDNPSIDGITVNLTTKQLDEVMSGISILHLNSIYPRWTSHAYHGLIELCLDGDFSSISESELACIFKSSPNLRLFDFGFPTIESSHPADAQVTAISLSGLEVLNISQLDCLDILFLVRWIAPGTKPLHFGFHQMLYGGTLEPSIGSFFSRSHVTRVYAHSLDFLQTIELLEISPDLQELAVAISEFDLSNIVQGKIAPVTSGSCLGRIYLINSSVHIECITALVNIIESTLRDFVFCSCKFFHDGTEVPSNQEGLLLEGLRQNHLHVEFVVLRAEDGDVFKDWELDTWISDI